MPRRPRCCDLSARWTIRLAAGVFLAALGTVLAADEDGSAGRTGSADAPPGEGPQPRLVTAQTREAPDALAALEKPGEVFFRDGFETAASLQKYFEIRGRESGRAKRIKDPDLARSGRWTMQFTAPANNGRQSGAGASGWFGPDGYDTVYFRRYIRFAADYDQGNLHHVGGGLAGVAGTQRWRGMGKAGLRPDGDDRFSSSFEPWRAWGRYPPPGYMFFYTYWMDMKRDRDGHFWGNMLGPGKGGRVALKRRRWICLEHMIRVNDVGKANGELAAWIDGKLYLHYTGIRWRSSEEVKLKRFNIGIYVHKAARDNTVWYDDVALSTGYIGPADAGPAKERRDAEAETPR